jgi:hypothetical protein
MTPSCKMARGDKQLDLLRFGPDVEPLQGLDEIDWASVSGAYGPATKVPDQLRGMLARDPTRRHTAMADLYNEVCHQGTRYSAAPQIVPFLVKLAALPSYPERSGIVDFISGIAIGYDEYWIPGGFPIETLRKQSQSLVADDGGLDQAALDAYDAVRSTVPFILSLLEDGDPAVRCQAAYCLAWFPEHAHVIVPALVDHVLKESDETIAATALVSAGLGATADFADLVVSKLSQLRARSALMGWAAAVAYARLARASAPDWVPTDLCGWVARKGKAPSHDVPFLGGDLQGYAAASLLQGGEAWLDQATQAMLDRLRAVTGAESMNLLGSLLAATFPNGRLPADVIYTQLTDQQRRVIQTLAEAPKAWRFGGFDFGNVALLLGDYGLPSRLDELRRFAGLGR